MCVCVWAGVQKLPATASAIMKFDDVVEEIKPFGLYQKRMYFLVCLVGIPAALHTMVTVFIMATPKHR